MNAWEAPEASDELPEGPSDAMPMRMIQSGFLQALRRCPDCVRAEVYSFAGRPVRLRVVGADFAARTHRAFSHLKHADPSAQPQLTIDMWDEAEAGISGRSGVTSTDLSRQWIACEGTITASAYGRYVSFRYRDSIVILDRETQHMVGCRRDGAHLTGGDYSKPLLLMLSIWYQDRGVQLLHTGLLAHDGAGILVPGLSGTGKSTTSIAAIVQGLKFLGDDFVGLERIPSGGFLGHSLFSSACLTKDTVERFPELRSYAVEDNQSVEEKPILFLSEIFPERVSASVPIRAIVLLRIGNERTQIQPARSVDALRILTASTLHTLVPRPGRAAFRLVGDLVEAVPSWWLLLGPDIQDVRPSLERIAKSSISVGSGTETSDANPDAERGPRVLVLAESLPWPPLKGGDFRTWQNVHALSKSARVGVFGLCSNDTRLDAPPDVDLAFWTSSTDPALTSPPPKGLRLSGRAWLFDPMGHPSDLFYSAGAAAELARLLESFRPDIVLIEGLWLRAYLDVIRASGCRTILDCHNVEAVVHRELGRTNERQDFEGRVLREVIPARTEAIERAAVGAVDQLWVCSHDDEQQLRDTYAPRAPVVVIPNSIRLERYDRAPGRERQSSEEMELTMVYPGIFSYLPNAFAAWFLIAEVLPRLTSACAASLRLQLVGPMPTREMLAAAGRDPRIVVTGAVPDVRPFICAATVMPVPLFHGSGTRFKVLEAFAVGLPVVSTAKGVEGLGARHDTHVLIAETADEFVDGVIAAWRDHAMARRLTARARALAEARYSWDIVGPRIRGAVGQLHEARTHA